MGEYLHPITLSEYSYLSMFVVLVLVKKCPSLLCMHRCMARLVKPSIPSWSYTDGEIRPLGPNLLTCIIFNSLRPRPNRRHFADDIFKCIFENESEWTSPRISLKFVPKDRINNIPALVQIMAWRRPGDKPLSEPTMVSLLTQICVTRPQWVNHCKDK